MFFIYLYNYYIKFYSKTYTRPYISSNFEEYLKEIDRISRYYNNAFRVEEAKKTLKSLVLKIINALLLEKLEVTLSENSSFRSPLRTFIIISSLNATKINTLEYKNVVIFRNTHFIKKLLLRIIYTLRLLLISYLDRLEKPDNLETYLEARISN